MRKRLHEEIAKLPFLRDVQFAQELSYPTMDITIDRERAGQFGLTMADVARSVVPATSSSRFTQPNYWRDPNSGQAFQIQVQLPQNRIQSADELGGVPVMKSGRQETQLANIATLKPGTMPGLIERYNGQRVVSLTANLHGITLGEAVPQTQQSDCKCRNAATRRQRPVPRPDPPAGRDDFGLADRLAFRDRDHLPAAGSQLPVDETWPSLSF